MLPTDTDRLTAATQNQRGAHEYKSSYTMRSVDRRVAQILRRARNSDGHHFLGKPPPSLPTSTTSTCRWVRAIVLICFGLVGCHAPTSEVRPAPVPSGATAEVPPPGPSGDVESAEVATPPLESVALVYEVFDHRVALHSSATQVLIRDHLTVAVVASTTPRQRIVVGSFEQPSCQLGLPPALPVLSELTCVHDGPFGRVRLVPISPGRVAVEALEGPEGGNPRGGRGWTVGEISLPSGLALEESVVDLDEQRRAEAGKTHVVSFSPTAAGLRVEVGTAPAQRLVIQGFDSSGCRLRVDEGDPARIAEVSCPLDQNNLLLAYFGHEAARLWVMDHSKSAAGTRRVGDLRIPRRGALDVVWKPSP